jgi:nitrate/nitrite-specific signal transduction histidine kinase
MGWGHSLRAGIRATLRSGLRTRILTWIFIPTAIILALVALVNFYAYQRVTTDLVDARDQELTRLSASQLGAELKEYPVLLDSFARQAGFQAGDARQAAAGLLEARNRLVVFDGGVVVLDSFGRLLAAEPERPGDLGEDWSGQAFYRQITRELQPAFSNIERVGSVEVVVVAVPVTGEQGQYLGVMAGMFRVGAPEVSAFYGEIVKLRIGEGGRTYLLDGSGRVLYHSESGQIGADYSTRPAGRQALLGQVGSLRSIDQEGRDVLAAFGPVPGTPWQLVTELDWATLTAESRGYRSFLLLLLALGLLVPLAVVAIGVQRISRPLDELIQAAGEVASGKFGRILPSQSADEIGELTRQFNRMSSELRESYALLEKRVADRTQELEALYAADEELLRHLDVDRVLKALVDVAVERLFADKSSLMVWDEARARLVVRASHGFSSDTLAQMVFAPGEGVASQVAASGVPAVIEDTGDDERVATRVTAAEGIRSFMHFPIKVGDQVFGVFNVSFLEPRAFDAEEQRLFGALAQRAALAIENARLYREEQDRRQELQTLLEVASAASSSLDLDEMLRSTLDRLVAQVGASRAGVMLIDDRTGELETSLIRPERDIELADLAEMVRACQEVVASGEPLVVAPDPDQNFLEPGALLPLRIRGKVLGVLVIIGREKERFSREQQVLFQSIADQLGIAVENARLYEQAEEAAVAAERSRLARELHDAVTQTLFSASLIAEVLPRLWERDPEEGLRRLAEIRELSRGALAEMRTLLLELRPAALADTALGDLLRQLCEAFNSRARVPVTLESAGECSPPLEVKIALYRITQEALNNVAKHAAASAVSIKLQCGPDAVRLSIEDDGRGFVHATLSPEHLGLEIMQERAEAIQADLSIVSVPGEGTRVEVNWKMEAVRMIGGVQHA